MATHVRVHARDHFIVVNDLRLHYREWGAPTAPAVALLHGGSAHAHWWHLFAPACQGYRFLALDFRGHGDSAHASPPAYQIDDYADDVAAVVDRLGLPSIDLIGHSLGAMVATAYASRHSHRVHSLVVVDSGLHITPSGARYLKRLRHFPQPVYRDRQQAIQRFRLLPVRTAASREALAELAGHGIYQRPDGRWSFKFDREAIGPNGTQNLVSALALVRCPILFVRGALSTVFSGAALEALRTVAPHAEAVEIPNAHHHVMLDNPVAFEKAVQSFLERAHNTDHQARTTDNHTGV